MQKCPRALTHIYKNKMCVGKKWLLLGCRVMKEFCLVCVWRKRRRIIAKINHTKRIYFLFGVACKNAWVWISGEIFHLHNSLLTARREVVVFKVIFGRIRIFLMNFAKLNSQINKNLPKIWFCFAKTWKYCSPKNQKAYKAIYPTYIMRNIEKSKRQNSWKIESEALFLLCFMLFFCLPPLSMAFTQKKIILFKSSVWVWVISHTESCLA